MNNTEIILLAKESETTQLLTFNLESEYSFKVNHIQSAKEYEDYLEQKKDFFLLLIDGSISLGDAQSVVEEYKKNNRQIPLIIVSKEQFYQDLDCKAALRLNKEEALEKVKSVITELFTVNPLVQPMDYCPISFSILVAFEGLEMDMFIQLPSGRYIKLFQKEDKILPEDVDKFKQKGVDKLYLKKKTAQWIMKQLNKDIEMTMKALSGGKKIVAEAPPIEPEKENEEEDLTDFLAQIKKEREKNLGVQKKDEPKKEAPAEKKIEKLEKRVDGTLGITKEFEKEISTKTVKAVKIMAKKPSLKKLLDKMMLNRDPNDYVKNHVNLLTRVTCSLAQLMDWNHDTTLEKLIFVSYMHDILLVDHPHIARIQNLSDYKEVEPTLSKEEKELFLKHPEKTRDMIQELEEAPVDAEKIIFQHHERPDKSGFPMQIGHSRILPLAAVFIVAHDFVHYMLEHEDWKLDEYLETAKEEFRGGNFSKIMRKMSELEI